MTNSPAVVAAGVAAVAIGPQGTLTLEDGSPSQRPTDMVPVATAAPVKMEATMNLGSLIPWRDKSRVDVPRDDLYDPFVQFRREVDRMFDDFFGAERMQAWNGWETVSPRIDLTDSNEELVVSAEIPGLDEKDFELTLAGDLLTIKGEKKVDHEERNGNRQYVERRYGSFSRSVRLPFEAADQNVEAKYDKGVLMIRVPKPSEIQQRIRRIEVKAA